MVEGQNKILLHTDLKVSEFADFVKQYFIKCDSESPKQQYTVPGLSIYLNWTPFDLLNFSKESPLFSVIELALLKCEESLIQAMSSGRFDKTTGVFLLKNHFGYKEKLNDSNLPDGKTISEVLDALENIK